MNSVCEFLKVGDKLQGGSFILLLLLMLLLFLCWLGGVVVNSSCRPAICLCSS